MKINWIVNIRAFACFFIVLLHMALPFTWEAAGPTNISWYLGMVADAIGRSSVIIFFILSGYLYNYTQGKSKKRALYILSVGIVTSIAYMYWSTIRTDMYTHEMNIDKPMDGVLATVQLLMGTGSYHVWFLFVLGLIYLTLNRTKKFAKHFTAKNLTIFYTLLFIIFTYLIINSETHPIMSGILQIPTTSFLFYTPLFLFGMREFKDPCSICNKSMPVEVVIGLGGILIPTFLLGVCFIEYGSGAAFCGGTYLQWMQILHSYFNPLIVISSMGMISWFSAYKDSKPNFITVTVAKYSFIIYLIHPFILDIITITKSTIQ